MLSHLRDTILETVFTMPDDLRHGLAAYPRRLAAPECAVCGRPIVDQDGLAFADREHANLHETCAINISSRHIAQPPTWRPQGRLEHAA